MGAAKPA